MANYNTRSYTLNNGTEIPAIGLGTWQSEPHKVAKAVEVALKTGYRHIDGAAAYQNEKEVGEGIRASGVPRKEIWLTSKLNNPDHHRVAEALEDSLKEFGTDYLDLYLMHWPIGVDPVDNKKVMGDEPDFVETWAAMQELLDTGKVKAIGVSNFVQKNLEKLLDAQTTEVVPAVNQIELHPANPSPRLVAYCKDKGIHCTAYSCLGSTDSPLYTNQTLEDIAKAHGRPVQHVLLAWGVEKGFSVIPKSVTPERVVSNFNLGDFKLTEAEISKIDAIEDRFKVCQGDFLPEEMWLGAVFDGTDDEPGKGFVHPEYRKKLEQKTKSNKRA